jgi:uncharacterized protein
MVINCPVCKKETAWEGNPFRPFCSERCRTADLAKWASGEYTIPAEDQGSKEEGKEEK